MSVSVSLSVVSGGRSRGGAGPLAIYTAWVEDGIWNDAVPTGTPTWTYPANRGNAFTVWDDAQVTA
jgi:hypothetical protein